MEDQSTAEKEVRRFGFFQKNNQEKFVISLLPKLFDLGIFH